MGRRTRETSAKTCVLLVEDHIDSRQMYAEFLRFHFEVLEAGDGVDAIDLLGRSRVDIVVTDLALPRMDGYELIERIRSTPSLQELAVIALSGYSSPEHTDRARAAGSDVILQKPCLPETLAEAVAAAASRRKG